MFILVSVVEREINVETFKTMKDAQEFMRNEFYKVPGIEECLKEEQAELDESSAWCNADDGDTKYDWKIFKS